MTQPPVPPASSPSAGAPTPPPRSFGPRPNNHVWIAVLGVLGLIALATFLILRSTASAKDSPTHIAAKLGDLPELERLLKEDPSRANLETTGMSATPLHWAAAAGQLEAVKILLQYGADPNRIHKIGGTALHAAVHYKHGDVAEYLIAHGSLINAGDPGGRTALFVAAYDDSPDMVALLLRLKADGSIPEHTGQTPLGIADQTGHTKIVEMLRAAGYTQ